MRLFVKSLISSYVRSLNFKNLIKNDVLPRVVQSRHLASVENQFKYFNSEVKEPSASALMAQHKENTFSHQILESKPQYKVVNFLSLKDGLFKVDPIHDLDKLLNLDLDHLSSEEFVKVFKTVSVDASTNSLKPITHPQYANLCRAFVTQVNSLNDDQLSTVLLYLSIWPMSESAKTDSFNQVWKSVDEACMSRMREWSFDKILYFIDLWYLLKLTRVSDFVFKTVFLMHKKLNQLTSNQLVQMLFYFNTIRTLHKNIVMYNFEHKLETFKEQLSLEELGVSLLGFFKTRTSLRNEEFIKYIISRTIEQIETVPEITLASILKSLRLSMQVKVWRELPKLLDALTPQLSRFSLQCLTHVALLTAPSQTFHPPSLDYVSERLVDNIKNSRLKDMEKVLFPVSRLDYDPKTKANMYRLVVEELSLPSRQLEIETFPRCFIGLLHCLALRSIFPHHLIAKCLDMDFIHKTYGTRRYHFGRELAFIDTCVELECKDYTGPRLPTQLRSYLYGRYSHFLPNPDHRMSKHGELAFDLFTTAQALFGKASVKFLYTVPSHPRPDIVVRAGGLPEELLTREDYEGPFRSPNCGQTTIIVPVSKNMICHNSEQIRLNGETVSKLRCLELLGHSPKLVYYDAWPSTKSLVEKEQYLEHILAGE